MSRNKFLSIGFPLLSAILITACGNSVGNSTDTLNDTTKYPTQMDSVMKDNPDSVAKKEKPLITFASAQQALDFMQKSGHWNEYQAGILPRMAAENLEYCGKLLNNSYKYFIVVDKAAMKVILYSRYGTVVKEYGMACAKNYGTKHRKADSRTPEGFFSVEGIYDSTDWLFTNDNGYTSPARGQFGPRFIRIKNPVTTQIGIHGTASPGSIGKRVSHGCIRVKNENILELVKYAEAGMPVIVSPGPVDMRVNMNEGYDIKAITTGATKTEPAEKLPAGDTKAKAKKDGTLKTNPTVKSDSTATTKKQVTPKENQETTQPAAPAEEKPATPAEKTTAE